MRDNEKGSVGLVFLKELCDLEWSEERMSMVRRIKTPKRVNERHVTHARL